MSIQQMFWSKILCLNWLFDDIHFKNSHCLNLIIILIYCFDYLTEYTASCILLDCHLYTLFNCFVSSSLLPNGNDSITPNWTAANYACIAAFEQRFWYVLSCDLELDERLCLTTHSWCCLELVHKACDASALICLKWSWTRHHIHMST